MIYFFSIDDTDYEAELTVTPGRDATGPTLDGPGDPPEGAEIEIDHVWLIVNRKRHSEIPHGSFAYEDAERHLLDCGTDILKQADNKAMDAEAEAAEERAERRREDF